jgi:TetR/AcrR family transcriptional repressor of nem operon
MPRASLRAEIVESALTEFHRRGFAACSVENITSAAGVPKGSFYNHFKSKDDLGAEVVRRYSARSPWSADVEPGLSPLAEIRVRFTLLRDALGGRDFTRGCLIGNMGTEVADSSEAIRIETAATLERWSGRLAALIRSAQDVGEMDSRRDADLLGRFVVNAWEGAITRAKVVKSDEPMADFFTVVFDELLR